MAEDARQRAMDLRRPESKVQWRARLRVQFMYHLPPFNSFQFNEIRLNSIKFEFNTTEENE